MKLENINEIRKLKYNFIEKIDFHNILQIEDIKSFLEKRNCEVSCLLEKDFLELDNLFNTEIELFKKMNKIKCLYLDGGHIIKIEPMQYILFM